MRRTPRVDTNPSSTPDPTDCPFALLTGRPPLVALLARVQQRYVAEVDARLRLSPYRHLALAHSTNVLRFLAVGPRRASQIVQDCSVTKQALSQQIAHLEAHGYLTVTPDPVDHRARVLTITERGRDAQSFIDHCFGELEAQWAAELDDPDLTVLRSALQRALAAPAQTRTAEAAKHGVLPSDPSALLRHRSDLPRASHARPNAPKPDERTGA